MPSNNADLAPSNRGITLPFSLNDERTNISAYDCLYDTANSIGSTCSSTTDDPRTTQANFWSVYQTYERVMSASSPAANAAARENAAADLRSAYNKILGKITKYDTPAGETNPYDSSLNKLQNELDSTRAEYDEKLASIMKLKDSGYDEYKSHYESTLMSGILWGTLAGTIIYYVFYK